MDAEPRGPLSALIRFCLERKLVVAYAHGGQLAEARIHAVYRFSVGHDIIDQFLRLRDAPSSLVAEVDDHGLEPGPAQFVERNQLVVDCQVHDAPPMSTMGRLSPCSRAHSIAMSYPASA